MVHKLGDARQLSRHLKCLRLQGANVAGVLGVMQEPGAGGLGIDVLRKWEGRVNEGRGQLKLGGVVQKK